MSTFTIKKIILPNGDVCKIKDDVTGTATTSSNGLMSSPDKTKLDGMVVATLSEFKTYLGIS